jgi:hypothetical protein
MVSVPFVNVTGPLFSPPASPPSPPFPFPPPPQPETNRRTIDKITNNLTILMPLIMECPSSSQMYFQPLFHPREKRYLPTGGYIILFFNRCGNRKVTFLQKFGSKSLFFHELPALKTRYGNLITKEEL